VLAEPLSAGPAVSAPKAATRRKGVVHSRLARREAIAAYVCLLPWLLGLLGFTLYPMLASLYYSFTNYVLLSGRRFVGLLNYRYMFRDPLFLASLRVTGEYAAIAVPGGMIIGYACALLLNNRIRGLRVWRTIYFLPSIVPAIAGAFIWAWMFNGQYGVVNGVLSLVGIQGPEWFGSTTWVLPAFIIMTLWTAGGGMILYLAALQQVPTTLYEAASIDGANAWYRFIHVTLPMTSPVILFTFITSIIASFQIFTAGFVITQGGPDNASLFYILNLYNTGWQNFQIGYASAQAWMLVLILFAITALAFVIAKRWVFYNYAAR
jgi:multiple sugar transport system permease protein